jgi:hypothetical protein
MSLEEVRKSIRPSKMTDRKDNVRGSLLVDVLPLSGATTCFLTTEKVLYAAMSAVSIVLLTEVVNTMNDGFADNSDVGGKKCSDLLKEHFEMPLALAIVVCAVSVAWAVILMAELCVGKHRVLAVFLYAEIVVVPVLFACTCCLLTYNNVVVHSKVLSVSREPSVAVITEEGDRQLLYRDPSCDLGDGDLSVGKHVTTKLQTINWLAAAVLVGSILSGLLTQMIAATRIQTIKTKVASLKTLVANLTAQDNNLERVVGELEYELGQVGDQNTFTSDKENDVEFEARPLFPSTVRLGPIVGR